MAYVSVQNLRYKYPTGTTFALDDISFEVDKGEVVGIVGPNNAGKSTLCEAFVGLVPNFTKGSFGGKIVLDGLRIKDATPDQLVRKAGIVFQNPFTQVTAAKLTVYEEVAFGLENLGLPREQIFKQVDAALDLLGLNAFKDRNPFSLSGGQMQRMAIASIIAMQPEIMVFDEPTSQLDPQGTEEVFTAIRSLAKHGVTILIAEHKLEKIAAYCDRVLFLSKGKLIGFDTPEKIFNLSELQQHGLDFPVFTQVCRSLTSTTDSTPKPVQLEPAAEWIRNQRSKEHEL